MKLEDRLTKRMLEMYERAGREVHYWGRRFKQSVDRKGGLATARRMLKHIRNPQAAQGFDALVEAGRLDLSLEKLVLRPEFKSLFTAEELAMARQRLRKKSALASIRVKSSERLYPEEAEPGKRYLEGATRRVLINAFERDAKARNACIKIHGTRCAVCNLNFRERYGTLGDGFIHVHHVRPLSGLRHNYKIDPRTDLVPVCPNCHAMLHRGSSVMSVAALRKRFRDAGA